MSQLNIAVTGATGTTGSRLTAKLTSQGHVVRVLTRDVAAAKSRLQYPKLQFFDPSSWDEGIAGCTSVVNLAGEPIGTRWTPQIKREIKRSRIDTTTKLVKIMADLPSDQRPRSLVSFSAVGYYGISQTAAFTEDSPSGSDYLSEICREWEKAALAAPPDVRVVILRCGVVLAKEGGVLAKMLPIFEVFAGGPLGSGNQWISWIHRDDLVELIIQAIKDDNFKGVYNATAPKPVRMAELCSALGGLLGRPSWLPVPDFAIKTLLGEGAMVVLEGQKVLPNRTQQQGFRFKYTDINNALGSLLRQ